jgi:hypothetical protein
MVSVVLLQRFERATAKFDVSCIVVLKIHVNAHSERMD